MPEGVESKREGVDLPAVIFLEVGEILLAGEVVLLPFGHLVHEDLGLSRLLVDHLHQLNNLTRGRRYDGVEGFSDPKNEVSHDLALLVDRMVALDDGSVDLPHLSV